MMPMQFTMQELLEATGGELLHGTTSGGVNGLSTDTRTIHSGEAFLALRGPRFNGQHFVDEAIARGAAALIVHRTPPVTLAHAGKITVIGVADPLHAYGALARWHRQRFDVPVVAITGSCGKTTTKEYLSVLLGDGTVLKSPRTENNAIGVPRTLLRLRAHHTVAIVELGSNHPGEMAYLRDLVQPTHAIITNIGPAHLEFFHSEAGVAREKFTLLDTVPAAGGLVLNADDAWMQQWLRDHASQTAPRITTFGTHADADVRLEQLQCHSESIQFLVNGEHEVVVPTIGPHHAMNAIAALACAQQLGGSLEALLPRLAQCPLIALRMERLQLNGGPLLLCDCYNANPLSMAQAIRTLAHYPVGRRRILVAGEMRELGTFTTTAHCDIGQWAMEARLDGVIAIGAYASLVLAGAHTAMQHTALLMAYETVDEACARIPELLRPDDVILIKGSRGAQLERLATSCQQRWSPDAVLAEQSA